MIIRFLSLAVLSVLILTTSPFVLAEEEQDQRTAETAEQNEQEARKAEMEAARAEQREAAKKMRETMGKLIANASPEEQKHFYMVYSNYNLIGTVKMIQGDVDNAIKECSKNNPDMEDALKSRFRQWSDAVNPVMTEADANLNNMILAQDYAKTDEIRATLKVLDDNRKKANDQIKKIPVTTPEACQYLLDKMDETEKTMVSLLRSTLITFPQAFPNTEPSGSDEDL